MKQTISDFIGINLGCKGSLENGSLNIEQPAFKGGCLFLRIPKLWTFSERT